MAMFYSAERAKRIFAEQKIMRSGEGTAVSLCQYKHVSCVRCCLPHIGGDSHLEDSEEKRSALFNKWHWSAVYNHARQYGKSVPEMFKSPAKKKTSEPK